MGNSGMKLQLRLAILLGSILRRWGVERVLYLVDI